MRNFGDAMAVCGVNRFKEREESELLTTYLDILLRSAKANVEQKPLSDQ